MEDEDLDLCNDLFLAIPLVHDRLVKPFESLLRAGMSPMQFYTLVTLQAGGCMTMSELAAHFCIPKQQMTKIVNRLAELCTVERKSDPADRRLILVCLSAGGREYLAACRRFVTGQLRGMMEGLEDADKRELLRALHSIHMILPKLPSQNAALAEETAFPLPWGGAAE